ncbi:T9SS-dependent choice-of-anchor J family protein [Epilithonimonas hungarica]|uniref:Por secretion system C-terminal sorting domain-containing protein n=1 Tax=Epilithonimonas hungarica TaxID=454006 RepID=A0A1G7RRF1_9FLAO|nr:choice-of-anchor J domain-containing protein [Epilithonimonas hungarica]SDG12759.1 Por secretion system C-terminal sorting domain-containing protein [Epilithonimonas hungarica]
MNKKIISLLALSLVVNINAQVFNAGFENNNGTPLSQFKTINADGLTVPEWAQVQDFNEKAWIQFYDGYDNKIAFSTSYYVPEGQANDWLITPAITIPNTGTPTLYWKGKSYDFEYTDSYAVKISETNDNMESFSTLTQIDAEQPFDYASHSLDLSDYKGKTIYLAFVNNTNSGTYLALDDLYISQSANCVMPLLDGFSVSDLKPNSVKIDWSSTSGINNYDTGITTFDTTVSSKGITSSTTKNFDNLQSGKRYQFFLKNADCGSGWAGPKSVWTPTELPYSYDFEKTVENYGEYDSDGWTSTTWLMGENGAVAQNGSGYAYNNTSTSAAGKNDWIFSYPIYLKNGETVTAKYYTSIGNESADPAILKVAVASAPDKNNIIENLSIHTVSQQTYSEHTVTYTATADQVYYIGFGNTTEKVTTTTALRLDNVSFTKSNLAVTDVNQNNIKTYPNPVVDFLNIKTDDTIKSVEIYAIDGKLIKKVEGNNNKVDFRNYQKGSYLVKIETNESVTSQKVIK